jgi:hypothetical protein
MSYSQAEIDEKWYYVRAERNNFLSSCDWTQVNDSPLSQVDKDAWATYRQALRDITLQQDPFNIIWPVSPEDT